MKRLELLAPAGDMAALIAAVQNGADAVYLGAGAFNARRNAGNFDGDALDAAVAYCHARGVKVHVTLNTLVREDEFAALTEAVRAVNRSGADAVIVQDFGVARALKALAPDLQRHASTQMAVHNRQGVAFLAEQGFDRAVLARELTFSEIADCARAGIETEVFVHGALCVACSGQCLLSSLVGGRSGNRGLCAQPCRLPWRLDGRGGCLLSTRDLCAIDDLAALRDAGVTSLKIEGRLKRAEYVAVTVAAYRKALDDLYAGRAHDTGVDRRALLQMFNRGGFTRGYGPGVSEGELMYPERPNHVGVAVGACRGDGTVALEAAVSPADALVLRGRGEDKPVRLSGDAGARVRCDAARRGDALFRLVSDEQIKAARDSFDGEHRQTEVAFRATLRVGEAARLEASDGVHRVVAAGDVIQAATGRPFDPERARAQLEKTGGTPFRAASVELDADENAFCPASLLNALRRDALDALLAARAAVRRREGTWAQPEPARTLPERPRLLVQSADPAQLMEALEGGADGVILAPRDLRAEALEGLDPEALAARGKLGLALPAVMPAEALEAIHAWALAHREAFGATWLSNVGQLGLEWPGRRAGDFMLNVFSNAALAQLNDWGIDAYAPSVELNAGQIAELGGETALTVWGRLPLMHLRHCPLRAVRGMKGKHADCRHCDACAPGERLDGRSLEDRRGAAFPLERVAMPGGCVIRLLNCAPIMPLRRLSRIPRAAAWRLLLTDGEPAAALTETYRAAIDGADFKATAGWRYIDGMQTTTGHFFRGVE